MNFKLLYNTRKKLKLTEPTTLKKWLVNLTSEIFATAVLSFLFAGLFIVLPNHKFILNYFYTSIFVSIYSGFVVIGILFVFFIRWSADANPIISIYKMIVGKETYRYAFAKMIAQLVGAIIAGLLVWLCTQSVVDTTWNIFIPSTQNHLQHGFFDPTHTFSIVSGFFFCFSIEVIVGLLLLWSVFSESFDSKYRFFIVLGITMLATLIGSSAQIMNFNPVRAFAQDIGAIFTNQMTSEMWITLCALVLGSLSTPFLLVILQWFISKYLIVWITWAIEVKIPTCKFIQLKSIKSKKRFNKK